MALFPSFTGSATETPNLRSKVFAGFNMEIAVNALVSGSWTHRFMDSMRRCTVPRHFVYITKSGYLQDTKGIYGKEI